MSLETVLGYLSTLHWIAPGLDLPTLVGTTATLHACDAVMCGLFARNNGYPRRLWTCLGLALGVWAVAVLIVLPRRVAPGPGALPAVSP